jgi:hypothetical protein
MAITAEQWFTIVSLVIALLFAVSVFGLLRIIGRVKMRRLSRERDGGSAGPASADSGSSSQRRNDPDDARDGNAGDSDGGGGDGGGD